MMHFEEESCPYCKLAVKRADDTKYAYPCKRCGIIIYCSKTCRNKHTKSKYHETVCNRIAETKDAMEQLGIYGVYANFMFNS